MVVQQDTRDLTHGHLTFDPGVGARDHLRAATQMAHARLDAQLGRFNLRERAGYLGFLQAQYPAIAACEAVLAISGVEQLLQDWPSRMRKASLATDIADLGGRVIEPCISRSPLSTAAAFGMLYVLEGSRLGAAFLIRRVPADLHAAARYLRHGAGLRLWPTFLTALEKSEDAQGNIAPTVAAAMTTFAMFEIAASTQQVPC